MATLENGRLPDDQLAFLPWPEADHLRLRPDAAEAAGRLAAQFARDFGTPLLITDGYRTFAAQVKLKKQKGKFAAKPGTSNHGWGLALDIASRINIDDSTEHRWMEDNGPGFGWINPPWAEDFDPSNGQHEPWHWEYDPDLDNASTTPAAAFRLPRPQLETDMRDFLIALYLKNLGRLPDAPGFATHLSEVATGRQTWAQIERELAATPESQAFAALGSEEARNAKRVASGFVL